MQLVRVVKRHETAMEMHPERCTDKWPAASRAARGHKSKVQVADFLASMFFHGAESLNKSKPAFCLLSLVERAPLSWAHERERGGEVAERSKSTETVP